MHPKKYPSAVAIFVVTETSAVSRKFLPLGTKRIPNALGKRKWCRCGESQIRARGEAIQEAGNTLHRPVMTEARA